MPAHLAAIRREYGRRRDAMLNALQTCFPAETRWREPASGLFIWVELPDQVDTNRLFNEAIEKERVAFIPGQAFDVGPDRGSTNGLRLNFSNSAVEQIEDGIARLGRVLKRHLAKPASNFV